MKNDGVKPELKVKKFKKSVNLTARREKSLKRLEAQLKKGTKVIHEDAMTMKTLCIVPLTVKDVQRIEREITTLKARV